MPFKDIFIYSSDSPFAQRSKTICAILIEGINYEEHFCEIILNLDKRFRRRCCLKIFYLELWQAFLFSEAAPFIQFW